MKQDKLKITDVAISQLKPAPYNPRKWSEKVLSDIRKSIERFGLVDPLVVNSAPKRKNIVIGGHLRLKVAKELGYKKIPVVFISVPDIQKERELNLRLNKNLGEFSYDLLSEFDEDLLKDVGFESEELDKIFDLDIEEDDFDVDKEYEKITKPKSRYGDLYQLGEHRLMCGDATKREDVEKLMAGEKADMVFTDPPYGINLNTDYSYKAKNRRGNIYNRIIGDDKRFNPDFIFDFFGYVKEIFLFGGNYYADKLPELVNCGWFVWDKTLKINQNTGFAGQFEIIWSKQKHKQEIIRYEWFRFFGLQNEDIKRRVHPTQKPIKLCEWFIEKFSKRGQVIVDLFGGSGSTLIAAEQLNRKCYMMELDPKYIDVIIARWEKFTGQKAVKL